MIRRPPRSTRTDTLFPYTTLFRAQQAATIGAVQEEQHRAKVRQLAGAQRADFAARGIDLRSGVVQDLVGETYKMGEGDALTRSDERRVGKGCVRTGRYRWSPDT